MERGPSDNERILGFVEDCRDAHVAPYPVGRRDEARVTEVLGERGHQTLRRLLTQLLQAGPG